MKIYLRGHLVLAFAFLTAGLPVAKLSGQQIYTFASIRGSATVTVDGMAQYRNSWGNPEGHSMGGWLAISNCLYSSGWTFWDTGTQNPYSSWSGTVDCPGWPGHCHRGRIEAQSYETNLSQAAGTEQICISAPDPPPPPPGDDDNNCGGPCSPILIDVSGDGYALTGAADGVLFDIDGNGSPNRISWTRAGSDDAFLWLDGNGNGVVDNGMELFGDAVYDNGFDKLDTYDDNRDGVVDASDAIWPSLRLWTDWNHNGISEGSELATMRSSGFTRIGVTFKAVGKKDKYGNQFRYKGRIYASSDKNGAEQVFDIIFVGTR